ncbi:hypothetical protein G9A89_011735 [Geosiphon pyriformis]|nr:hypothetical protein G9A89_011735 [Geosiphon pyriformis]
MEIDDKESEGNFKPIELTSIVKPDDSESTQRIRELEVIEQLIVDLLNTSGRAILGLSLDGHPESESEIEPEQKKEKSSELNSESNYKTEVIGDEKPEKVNVKLQVENFKTLAEKYRDLIDRIQLKLREQFRGIRMMGITTGDVPFHVVTYGEEKEFDSWADAVKVLRIELEKALKLAIQTQPLPDNKIINDMNASKLEEVVTMDID